MNTPVYGYEGYTINQDGEIHSFKKFPRGILKKSYPDKKGYLRTTMAVKKGKYRTEYIHRLVWMSFNNKKIPKGLEINHKDGNKSNNNLNNLEVVTHKENMIHAHRTGLATTRKAVEARTSIFKKWYPLIKTLLDSGYKQRVIAEMIGTTSENISRIKKKF